MKPTSLFLQKSWMIDVLDKEGVYDNGFGLAESAYARMASGTEMADFLSSQACTFGQPPTIADSSSPSTINSSIFSTEAGREPSNPTSELAESNPFRVLMNMMAASKPITIDLEPIDLSGDDNLIYDLELDRWITRKDQKSSSPAPSKIKRSSTVNPRSRSPDIKKEVKPMAESSSSSSKDPISSLFADRAARFSNTEAAARQAEINEEKAAKAAQEARLKARRERVERLAMEKLEDDKLKRGKEWDRKAYDEKVRAQAVMEVERKKMEDIRERERIKRNIADDEEGRRLQRQRLELKYGRRVWED